MMLRPAKKIWDMLRLTYGHENISRVFEVYKQFTLRQGDRSVQEYFTLLRAFLNELEIYQSLTADITQIKQYCEELAVAIYLFSWNSDLSSQNRGQILRADSVPNLQFTFARVLCISTATPSPCLISQPWQLHVVEGAVAPAAVVMVVQTMEDGPVALIVDRQVIGLTDAEI